MKWLEELDARCGGKNKKRRHEQSYKMTNACAHIHGENIQINAKDIIFFALLALSMFFGSAVIRFTAIHSPSNAMEDICI